MKGIVLQLKMQNECHYLSKQIGDMQPNVITKKNGTGPVIYSSLNITGHLKMADLAIVVSRFSQLTFI